MIHEGKLIKVFPHDRAVIVEIKIKFNQLVALDQVIPHTFNGKKYNSHTAWNHMNKLLIRINRLRWKHFCFDHIPHDLYKPKLN